MICSPCKDIAFVAWYVCGALLGTLVLNHFAPHVCDTNDPWCIMIFAIGTSILVALIWFGFGFLVFALVTETEMGEVEDEKKQALLMPNEYV